MKFDKKVMESGVVAAFSLVLACTAVPAAGVQMEADPNSRIVEFIAETTRESLEREIVTKVQRRRALAAAAVEEAQQEISRQEEAQTAAQNQAEAGDTDKKEEKKSEEKAEKKSEKKAEKKAEEKSDRKSEKKSKKKSEKKADKESKENKEEVKEASPWDDKLMPNVEEYLNIRTEASEEAEPAGKLPKGAEAEILERGEEWTKIASGSVEGYVKNEFCVTGEEAEALAGELGTTYATAVTGGVRVRETASSEEDVTILHVLEEEEKIKVDTEAEKVDGWIGVKVDDMTGYISADYVEVKLELGKAISVEEERAAIEAAEAERRAQEASQSQGGGTQQKAAVAASYDDVTLLGALIQCEAGSECYEGQVAVGAVVMNRVRAGYAGSISGVIYQSGQFTPASNGMLAGVLSSGVSGSCLQAAQQAIGGTDNVGGATSFRNVASGIQGLVIGNHVFF